MEGMQYERKDLTETLCNELQFGDKKGMIRKMLGQPDLDYGDFEQFPEAILKLESLRELSMVSMYGSLKNVRSYDILSRIETLKILDISTNFLGSFPEEISLLSNLDTLSIEGNGIKDEAYDMLKILLPNVEIINKNPF
jgi:hypothetical protein